MLCHVQLLESRCDAMLKNFRICFIRLSALAKMTLAFVFAKSIESDKYPPTLWLVTNQLSCLRYWFCEPRRDCHFGWNSIKPFPSTQINCPAKVSTKLLRLRSWTCTGTKMGWRHKNEGNWKLNWTSFGGVDELLNLHATDLQFW